MLVLPKSPCELISVFTGFCKKYEYFIHIYIVFSYPCLVFYLPNRTPGPGTEESSSSSGSSSFWDSYRIYIIIVLCCIVFVAMLFALHTYNNRDEKSGGVIDPKNRSFKLTDEGSINSRSYSRQRFFEKPVEVDHEANNTSAVVDPFEFEHNLDHVQAPPAAQDFQFQQDPEEDRRAHYYAERDKYNANFREQEMAAAKGRALANTGKSMSMLCTYDGPTHIVATFFTCISLVETNIFLSI